MLGFGRYSEVFVRGTAVRCLEGIEGTADGVIRGDNQWSSSFKVPPVVISLWNLVIDNRESMQLAVDKY